MKAPAFRYIRPRSLPEAYRILDRHGAAAVALAGGQSLLAGLNMRLSAPELLVDLNAIEGLGAIAAQAGHVTIGALTRHRDVERSEIVRRHLPLLSQAIVHVAHPGIRNRGTLGGSLAYADPAAELPACSVALGAIFVLGSAAGEREVHAEDFFKGLFETDLRPGELILAARFPVPAAAARTAFAELSRRRGDFALAGLAAVATVSAARIERARFVYFGCVDRARVADAVSAAVAGRPAPATAELDAAVERDLAPDDTPGCRGSTKLHLAKVLTRRVVHQLSQPV